MLNRMKPNAIPGAAIAADSRRRINLAQRPPHRRERRETVGDRVGFSQAAQTDRLNRIDEQFPEPRHERPPARFHALVLPSTNRRAFLSAADGLEETFLEKELGHGCDE